MTTTAADPAGAIAAILAEELAGFKVPGAIATVVLDGEVVFAGASGVSDTATRAPVTDQTLFMLASDTKCFSAAMLCTLVEEGRLDLDAPVRDYLPWFEMADPRLSALVNTRDLLAHRTGLPRHDYVGIGDGNALTNAEAARAIAYLAPVRPFRSHFGYSNLHTQVAVHVAEVITGQSFEELLTERILDPLGATTLTLYDEKQTAGDFARPYQTRGGQHVRVHHESAHFGPNGGLVTDARDISRWLLARLGRDVDGTRVLSDEVLAMLHQPATVHPVGAPFPELNAMGYALCNSVTSYRGKRVQFHGGGAIGHRSEVMVLPHDGIGIAVQCNESDKNFPMTVCLRILDHLFGFPPVDWRARLHPAEWPEQPLPPAGSGRPGRDVDDYAGSYRHPAYGEFGVRIVDGAPRVSFHGLDEQLIFTHDDLDRWHFGIWDFHTLRYPVVFRGDPDGGVADLTIAFEEEADPIVFTRV